MVLLNGPQKTGLSKLVEEDLDSLLEFFHGDPAFTATIKGLLDHGNQEQLWAIITNRVLESYKGGLMQCYDLFKKYGREQVYEFIDQFEADEFYKNYIERIRQLKVLNNPKTQ